MQQGHSSNSREASAESSHGEGPGADCQRRGRGLLTRPAAMMRHWLRVLHAVLREGPVRTSVHDLVAQLEARLDDERVSNTLLPEGGRHCQEGGQTKRRKYLNYFQQYGSDYKTSKRKTAKTGSTSTRSSKGCELP